MDRIRPPAAAGSYYPADASRLRQMVSYLIDRLQAEGPAPKALIAPHAGYIYSGPIAASAFARIRSARTAIRKVVLLGPAHFVPVDRIAASSAEGFQTPIGTVKVHQENVREALTLDCVRLLDAAHAPEHSLETHLPFLQVVLEAFEIVPFVVGQAAPDDVHRLLERLWGGPETLITVSTDLSHFQDYETAREIDTATCRAIESLRPEKIGAGQACGYIPLKGLLLAARERGLQVETLDLRSSGDIAGPRDSVVGYGAWALTEGIRDEG